MSLPGLQFCSRPAPSDRAICIGAEFGTGLEVGTRGTQVPKYPKYPEKERIKGKEMESARLSHSLSANRQETSSRTCVPKERVRQKSTVVKMSWQLSASSARSTSYGAAGTLSYAMYLQVAILLCGEREREQRRDKRPGDPRRISIRFGLGCLQRRMHAWALLAGAARKPFYCLLLLPLTAARYDLAAASSPSLRRRCTAIQRLSLPPSLSSLHARLRAVRRPSSRIAVAPGRRAGALDGVVRRRTKSRSIMPGS